MDTNDIDRRAVLVGVGGALAGTLIAARARSAPPQPNGLQAVLDKIARTDQGFSESCLPVQAFPGTGNAAFTLTQPGSYYLNGNVVVAGGQDGIEIAADHVELDLDGYSVIGPGGASGTASGRGIVVNGRNAAIYSGSVAGFDVGVDMTGATYSMAWDVTCMDCVRSGFACGALNQHYDNEAHRCGTGWHAAESSSLVQECGAFSCAVGFRILGSRNLVLSNSAADCPVPFDIRPGNAWGPIVAAAGDLSLVPNASDVNSNMWT